MNGWACAAAGLIAAGFAALRYGDRIRIAIEVHRFRRAMREHERSEALIAEIDAYAAEILRRIRERYGEGGDA